MCDGERAKTGVLGRSAHRREIDFSDEFGLDSRSHQAMKILTLLYFK